MKDHCDFSKGTRGKFFKPDAIVRLSVYLDEKVQDNLTAKADARGVNLTELVNDTLKKDIELIEMARQTPANTIHLVARNEPNACENQP